MFAQRVLTLLILLATWLAAAANVTKPQPGLTLDKDSFFKPPQGWENKQPGDILRWRQIQSVAHKMKPKLETAYQLLYRTTRNSASQPLWTVTTVFVPHNTRRDSFVMVSDPTNSDGPMCQPSYQYMGGGNPNDKGPGPETLFLPYMSLGYIVSLPDVEGPKRRIRHGTPREPRTFGCGARNAQVLRAQALEERQGRRLRLLWRCSHHGLGRRAVAHVCERAECGRVDVRRYTSEPDCDPAVGVGWHLCWLNGQRRDRCV